LDASLDVGAKNGAGFLGFILGISAARQIPQAKGQNVSFAMLWEGVGVDVECAAHHFGGVLPSALRFMLEVGVSSRIRALATAGVDH